jgi:hypothetical protein
MAESNITFESKSVAFKTNDDWIILIVIVFAFNTFWPDIAGTWFWDFFHFMHQSLITHIR